MKKDKLFRKLFVSHRFFTIAIRKKRENSFLDSGTFVPDVVLPALFENWQADPMLVEDGNTTYLFYEKVVGNKGHIEVAEVLNDGNLGASSIVLKADCHYSYPFVFKIHDEWYMIPESSQISEVALYKAVRFPFQWTKAAVLLNERAVDTTVFAYKGKIILLTFYLVKNSERVEPHAFELLVKENDFRLEEISWDKYDQLQVRGAGPVIEKNGQYIRPAQISREQIYGDGLVFFDVHMVDSYEEMPLIQVFSNAVIYKNKEFYVDGLHTYSSTSGFEVIDLRGGTIDYFKPIKKLMKMILKK